MSRSREKSPFTAVTTAASDKQWKKEAAKKVRLAVRQKLAATEVGDALPFHRYQLVTSIRMPSRWQDDDS